MRRRRSPRLRSNAGNLLAFPGQRPRGVNVCTSSQRGLFGLRSHSLVDVSHRQTGLEMSGPRAADILNSGCPLDLDVSAFAVGMCTRTVFAKAEIVLWRIAADVFRLEVWRSFTDYVARFLGEVAREY